MIRSLVRRTTAAALMFTAAAAAAQPLTFTFTGIGSGTFGTTAFTDRAFTIALPINVATGPYTDIPGPSGWTTVYGNATLGIEGVLAPSFLVFPSALTVYQATPLVQLRPASSGLPFLLLDFSGTSAAAAVAAYALRTPFGPVTTTVLPSFSVLFVDVRTQAGDVTLTQATSVTFQAFTPTATTAPEPATLALVGVGLLLVGGALRRRA